MKKILALIGVAASLATASTLHAAGSAVAGQVQTVIDSSVVSSNINYVLAATTVSYNLPGWDTNTVGYVTGQSNAPVFYAVDARQLALSGRLNLTATNTTTETFTLLCSEDNLSWFTPSKVGVLNADAITFSTLNVDYSVTNLVFGTNIDTGGWPLWAIGSYRHSGASGVATNLSLKAFTKRGGL